MGNNLFITGFPYDLTEAGLASTFSACGQVLRAKILVERDTGRSRGLGFVLMATDAEAQSAIQKLNGTELGHRRIFVTEARPNAKAPDSAPAYTGPERRSGWDRRRNTQAPTPAPEKPWQKKKPWEKKPWEKGKSGPGDAKPWKKKAWGKGEKAGPEGAEKPWQKKKPWEKKPWEKKPWDKKPWPKKDQPGAGAEKPWKKKAWSKDDRPGPEGAENPGQKKSRPWEAMYRGRRAGQPGPEKKWSAGGPNSGRKPGDFKSKPGGFKRRPGGGYRG